MSRAILLVVLCGVLLVAPAAGIALHRYIERENAREECERRNDRLYEDVFSRCMARHGATANHCAGMAMIDVLDCTRPR